MQGDGPTGVIDHLDGVKTNNAISNLRDATPAENRANSRQKRSRSGIAGIQRADNKWEVCVRRKNLRYRLGHYDTIPEAKTILDRANSDEVWLLKQKSSTTRSSKITAVRDVNHGALLKALFYNPDTGCFHPVRCGHANLNVRFGSICGPYRRIKFLERRYPEHVLAFFYMTKQWPIGQIDHINGDGQDNRFENLREVTVHLNAHNRKSKNDQDIGIRQTRNKIKRWESVITVKGERIQIGTFDTKKEAHEAWIGYREKTGLPMPHHLSPTNYLTTPSNFKNDEYDLMPQTRIIFDYLMKNHLDSIFTVPQIAPLLGLSSKALRAQLHYLLNRGLLNQTQNYAPNIRGGGAIVGWSLRHDQAAA
jgi:hypothetical protein